LPGQGAAPNLIKELEPSAPNQVWASDITYVATLEGWLYLAVILDLFSRRVVGWKLGESLEAELVVTALRNALVLRQPDEGLYFHSDRGSQYSSEAVRKPLSVIGANQSMSGLGNCYDNAQAEAFFSTLKTECFPNNQVFASQAQARREIFEYIEVYYNNRRLHSALGYQTPCQYETQFKRVIDIEIDTAQGVDAATENRAPRGRTSSADAALQTAGVAAYGQPTGPEPVPAGASPKRQIPGGSGGQSHPIPPITPKKPRITCPFFRGKYKLTSEVVREGSFQSLRQLVRAIESYLVERNGNPKKYVWRASGLEILEKIKRAREALANAAVIST
jgi:hypothetical protein